MAFVCKTPEVAQLTGQICKTNLQVEVQKYWLTSTKVLVLLRSSRLNHSHPAEAYVKMLNKRLLYAVIDTNTWIDEAYRLTMKAPTTPANQHHHENKENNKERDCVEQKVDGEGEHAWVINPSAFLQGLVTTEVKIVLPSQVVHELDGLKEHRQPHQARALSLALSLYTYI